MLGCAVLFAVPFPARADVLLKTRDGDTFRWESFSLEDGSYCTWLQTGKFCVAQSDIASIREVEGNPAHAQQNIPASSYQGRAGSSGTMTRTYSSESGDVNAYGSGRGGYGAAGAYYNRDSSSTTYSKEVNDTEIQQMENERYWKAQDAEKRQHDMEVRRQAEEAQAREREDRRRNEIETERQKREAARNSGWGIRYR